MLLFFPLQAKGHLRINCTAGSFTSWALPGCKTVAIITVTYLDHLLLSGDLL